MPHAVMPQFINALRDNLKKFEVRFGPPAELPKPPTDKRPSIQEVYDEMKLPDEIISGAYANGVMVGHSASEFSFDFIASFFPKSAVSIMWTPALWRRSVLTGAARGRELIG